MKKAGIVCVLAAGLLAGGCVSSISSINPFARDGGKADVRLLETSGSGFGNLLAQEYQNLAALEQDFMKDPEAAARYARKAESAATGSIVLPDDPTGAALGGAQRSELARSYNIILDALQTMASEDNANLLALAQTRYDCWLERAAEGRDEAEISVCRDMMFKALGLMTVPRTRNVVYEVTFADDDGIVLDDAAMNVIEGAARAWQDRPHWEVLLTGHTAARGDREAEKSLSMRRAVAVRNALAQQGIDPDAVTIVAHTDTAADTADGVSRRVDIRFEPSYLMKEGPVYESLEALGAF